MRNQVQWIQTEVAQIGLRPDGIIWVEIEPGVDQSVEQAEANLKVCKQLSAGLKRPLLIDLRGAMVLQPKTRLVYSDIEISSHFRGLAMVINKDPLSRMMINLYLQVATMPMPMKVFSDLPGAVEWLLTLK